MKMWRYDEQDDLYRLALLDGAQLQAPALQAASGYTIPAPTIGGGDVDIRSRVVQSGQDIDAALSDYRATMATTPRDQELDKLWRNVELRGTKASNDYSWTDALRDLTPLVVGSILSASVGEGRGMPEVLQLSLEMADKNAQRKQQKINSERDMAVSARNATLQRGGRALQELNARIGAAEALGRIPLALGALEARADQARISQDKLEIQKRKEDFDQNPQHPQAVAIKNSLIKNGVDPELVNSLGMAGLNEAGYITQAEYKRNWDTYETNLQAQRAAGNAAASTSARIGTESRMAPISADTARQVSAGSAAGGVEGTAAARAAQEYDIPGRTIVDPKVWNSLKTNPTEVAKARDQAQKRGEMIAALETMTEIRKQEEAGTIIPGARQAEYDAAKTKYMGMAAADMGMGTINEGDAERLQKFLPGAQASWLDIITLSGGPDIKASQLEGVLNFVKASDVRASRAVGLGGYGSAPLTTSGPPQQPNQGAGVQPLQPRSQSQAPTQTGGLVEIQTPHGPTMVTREQYEQLKRLGKVK